MLIGLMGSGKSTVGRMVAAKLGFQFVDTDHMITETAQGPSRTFSSTRVRRHSAPVSQPRSAGLLNREHCVIATGGGIVTQERNHPLLRHLGYIVWLEADPATLHRRTAGGNDRPLLKDDDPKAKLQRLLDVRRPLYKQLADLRIATDELSQDETAYGLAESARVHLSAPRTS